MPPSKTEESGTTDPSAGHRTPLTPGGDVASSSGAGEPLHLVLDDIKDYAVFMVSLDGKIASWNTGAERLKGWKAEEAVGLPFALLFSREDAAAGKPEREIQEAIEKGVYQGEGIRRRKDDSLFEAEVTLRLIQDEAGCPRALVKVTRDITGRKRLEAAERERTDFERQLIGIVSHDLRSPLTSILLSATLLLRRGGLDARQSHTVDCIVASSQRAIRLIRDLLDFTQAHLGRGFSIDPVPLDIHDLVQQVVDEVQIAYPGRQIVLENSGYGGVKWDSDRIWQLMVNLISNAMKYGSGHQPVRVTTRGEGDVVCLDIHNAGEPIPENEVQHIFEPQMQGARRGARDDGIGLGLFIVSHIVRAHGGTIQVHSTKEQGTTFSACMPRNATNTHTPL